MHHQHFNLSAEPFSLTPDPAFLFLSNQHREAMAAVQYGLLQGRGFITLIGEVGTGKTTVLYSVLSQLGPSVATAYVSYAAQEFDDLLAVALTDFGEPPVSGASRRTLLEDLRRILLARDAAGQRAALVIDEAQSLPDSTFEELRLLSNFETYTHKLLQIVLVGQPELHDRLQQHNLRQLRQRVSVRATIAPLDPAEMRAYIQHRLARAGGDETLFQPAALRALIKHAGGIPRQANILCHNALLFAFGRGEAAVSLATAREAIDEMERPPQLARRRRSIRAHGLATRRALATAAAAALVIVVGASLPTGSDEPAPRGDGLVQPDNVAHAGERAVETAPSAPAPRALPRSASAAPARVAAVPAPAAPARVAAVPAPAAPARVAAVPAPAAPARVAAVPEAVVADTPRVASAAAVSDTPPVPPAAVVSDTPRVTPAPAAARGPEVARVAQMNAAARRRQAAPPPPLRPGMHTVVGIPTGGSVLGVARTLYGELPEDGAPLLREIRRLNPGLRDIDVVQPGTLVLFPAAQQEERR